MKKFIICLVTMGLITLGHAQQAITLESVKLGNEASLKVDSRNMITFSVPQAETSLFTSNPVKFIEETFDINQFIRDNGSSDFDSYKVTFIGSSGILSASFDANGEMNSLYQNLKDVYVPFLTLNEIFREYRDWDVSENKYIALTRKGKIQKEFYKFKLVQGNKKKTVKVNIGPSYSKFAALH